MGDSRGARLRVAGCDLGKATFKGVVGHSVPGDLHIESTEVIEHDGDASGAFARWYREQRVGNCVALGATGVHADALRAPVLSGLPEDACLGAALAVMPELRGAVNLISIGAQGYSVMCRDSGGRVQHLENDKCSSGTGETMMKIARRFGLSIEEADALARSTTEAIPITARCSVFAKSEMTHFGNQGQPAAALFRGYFASVAKYVAALLQRGRVDGPVWVIGGGARCAALVAALGELLGEPMHVGEHPDLPEAIGAALLAAEQARCESLSPLPEDPAPLIAAQQRRFAILAAPVDAAPRVTRMPVPPVPGGAQRRPTILGMDLGSTGSKAVLTAIDSGILVLDRYEGTRGNPVDAAKRLVGALLERTTPDVRAVALTGSGREAAATVVRATFPELAARIFVANEIVAHGTAAIHCDAEGGESLSVVEIGGQDAKFIHIVGAQIVESDMNKACSAGTGSFLEEQAAFYGIDDIEAFTELAAGATRPPDLGQMCTVFIAGAAAEARNQGVDLPDLFAGFQFSVIYNYINRVMGQRSFGRRIFFQGKPATGLSLAWTLAAVSGREVIVPPNPGAMGAWGIGLCARQQLGDDALATASSFDLGALLDAEVKSRDEFQCKDKSCATLCRIERTTVRVGAGDHTVLSGGACPKYEIFGVGTGATKLPKAAPSAFDERRALLRPLCDQRAKGGTGNVIGIPAVGACVGYLPWLVTFVRNLGFAVRVLQPDRQSLSRGEERCFSFDACAPIKTAHAVVDTDAPVDRIFFPKLLTLGDRDGCDGRTCPMEQAAPEMVCASLRARGRCREIIRPVLSLHRRSLDPLLLAELYAATTLLGARRTELPRAAARAFAAQRRYEKNLTRIGQRTLDYGRQHDVPVVVTCGPLHVIHDPVLSAGIPRLLRDNGVLALPMDCYPVPGDIHPLPRIVWGEARRALRVGLAARARGGVYPILLSSFGCGPGSFNEQIFADLLAGYPHTILESDGHGGTAGFVTRVQAFLHTLRRVHADPVPTPVPPERLRRLEALPEPPITGERDKLLVIFSIGDQLSNVVAATYRAFGFDAVASGPAQQHALALGRGDCSGKECLPYQLVWGAFREHLAGGPPEKQTLLLQLAGQGMCRNCMFSIKDQISLDRLGLSDRVGVRHVRMEPELGKMFLARMWSGAVAWDILHQLTAYDRPLERRSGEVDALYQHFCDELVTLLGSPVGRGARRLLATAGLTRDLHRLIDRAAVEFARVRERHDNGDALRTVLLSGDIYLRMDDFGSDQLTRKLNARGLRVIVEPTSALTEYMAEERLAELIGLPTGRIDNSIVRLVMAPMRRSLYARARRHHPWLPNTDVAAMLDASRPRLDRFPEGEAPVTIGSVIHTWNSGACDGVVVVSPWGCGPALISESLLRHEREIPMHFVYCDGSPINHRRLSAFAFRLRRRQPRTPVLS